MNAPRKNRFLLLLAVLAAVLWTLFMGVGYVLFSFSDDVAHWLNRVFGIPAEFAQWLSAIGLWLEQWGGWLLLIVWATGLVALFLLSWFAARIARHFLGIRREGELT